MTVEPKRSCHSSGETVKLAGSGFSPERQGQRRPRRPATLDPLLNSNPHGRLHRRADALPQTGKADRTYTATDAADPTVKATRRMLVIAPIVNIRPADLDVGLRARIGANGFATGPVLYAHIVRTADPDGKRLSKQKARNLRLGRLKGRCGKLLVRKRLFSKRRSARRLHGSVRHLRRYDPRPARSSSCTPRPSRSSSAGRG